ncbi:MAG: hypothetical protein ABIH46_00520 [Chloroflexota bacterium]
MSATRAPRRVAPAELYRLRCLSLFAEKKALEARRAQNLVRELTLRLEAKYRLIGTKDCLDIHTGFIDKGATEVNREPVGDEDAGSQGPA